MKGGADASVLSRRGALGIIAAGAAAGLAACTKRMPKNRREVVLYSSVDDEYLRMVVAKFESEHDIRVLVKGDTEATKTTGLVERLRAEHAAGKAGGKAGADVWWSSEPFLTMTLADEGVFVPMADGVFGDLPVSCRGEGNLWGLIANRARVVVRRGGAGIGHCDIMWPEFVAKGPAIARPAFGTTRGHFGWVLAAVGEACFVQWLKALRSGGAKIVDGNSAVVRLVATGEAECGLTDSDDVWSGQAQGWPVRCERAVIGARIGCMNDVAAGPAIGPMLIPNSVAIVKGGRDPNGAAHLARFLLSEASERMLMESNSHNVPVRVSLRDEMLRGPLAPYALGASASRSGDEAARTGKMQSAGDGEPTQPSLRAIAAAAPRAIELARGEGLA